MGKENAERSHTDLELRDYLKYPASTEEIRAGLESWLREAMIMPFSYTGLLENGVFTAFGQGMVEMARHGLEERRGQVGESRAQADLLGVIEIERWLRDEARDGDAVALLSPPGKEKEGFGAHGQRRLSFTHLGRVRVEGTKKHIQIYSLPEKEIGIREHIFRINSVWDHTVGEWLRTVEKTDKGLVSTPLFIPADKVGSGFDSYVRFQGKESWAQVEEEVARGLSLKEDESAEERRKSLIDTITWQTCRYIDERDSRRLDNIGLVARVIMAREAAGKFLYWTPQQILDEYERIESAKWFQESMKSRGIIQKIKGWIENGAEAVQAMCVLNRLREQLASEHDVVEMLMGSSCGGGGIDDLMQMGRIGPSNYLDVLANRGRGAKENASSSSTTETMKCVKCPFCSKTVDAIVTSDKITCPECKKSASRG